MKRTIAGSVVVVVGATSGVGRATTRSLAAAGARLVIAARNPVAVEELVSVCEAGGSEIVGVAADIGVADDIERIVGQALLRFGRIDTWVNAASGLVVGPLECQTVDDLGAVVATNVLGTALASRAAIRQFQAQGSGVLVNVSSLLGAIPNPVVPTYSMTKFAIRGLTLSLHQATGRRSPIRACVVMPGPIDTPMFARAANRSGRAIRAIPPSISPERAAAAVIRSVRRPRRQRTTGAIGAIIVVGLRFAPRTTQAIVAQSAARLIFRNEGAPDTEGALHGVRARTGVIGGWRRGRLRVRLGDAVGRRAARHAG